MKKEDFLIRHNRNKSWSILQRKYIFFFIPIWEDVIDEDDFVLTFNSFKEAENYIDILIHNHKIYN